MDTVNLKWYVYCSRKEAAVHRAKHPPPISHGAEFGRDGGTSQLGGRNSDGRHLFERIRFCCPSAKNHRIPLHPAAAYLDYLHRERLPQWVKFQPVLASYIWWWPDRVDPVNLFIFANRRDSPNPLFSGTLNVD